MVSNPRAQAGAGSLRFLSQPEPVAVEVDGGGFPVTLSLRRLVQAACTVEDAWRLDDEWWRMGIARRYFRVSINGGPRLVVYHDLVQNQWYAQAGT